MSHSAASVSPLLHSRVISHTPFFYGWVILIAGTLGIVMIGPSQTFTVSLYIDDFVADLGLSRANISLLYGIATLGGSLLLPLTGRLVDRYGPRRMMVLVTAAFVVSLVAMSRVTGALSLLAAFLALRFLGFGSMQLVSNNVIAQWFVRHRGAVMGLAGQSLAISLVLFPALTELFIGRYTWRGAWVVWALLIAVIMLPVAVLFFRDRPELYGLHPDGAAHLEAGAVESYSEDNWTLAEALRTPAFWILLLALTAMTTILAGLVFHQASLYTVRGLDRSLAVAAFQAMALGSVAGNLGVGALLDRVKPRLIMVVSLVLLAAAMIIVQYMTTPAAGLIYAGLLGLVSGSYRVMDSTIWAKYFGRRHLGAIRGATMIGTVGGTALGAYPLGLSYDYTGSYATALLAMLVLPLGIGIAATFAKRPHRPVTGGL